MYAPPDFHVLFFSIIELNLLSQQSMVLLVGLEELSGNLRNIDRTKRDLKAAYPMIDLLLENAVAPSGSDPTRAINFADLVGCADCVAFPEANLVTNYLEGFVESVDSTYGCVSVHGGVVSATNNWFFLHPDETMLLSLYLQSESHASTLRDVPVFLPVKSPTVPFRLVTCDLVSGVTVSVLCGPSPSLSDLEDILGKCWGSSQPLLASLQSIHPRRFPLVKVDTSVLAFMVINLDTRKVLSSLQPHYCSSGDAGVTKKTEGSDMSPARKSDILRSFYRMTVGPIFPDIFIANPYGVDPTSGEALAYKAVPHAQLSHGVSDTYVVSEFHKCYALQHMQFQLFAIFMSAVPNHSMRNIANRTLDLVIKDKAFSIIK